MLENEKAGLDLFGKNGTKKTEYEKPKISVFAFSEVDVVRTSVVQESGGDTYLADLKW